MLATTIAGVAVAAALVTTDQAVLRAAPRESAQQQAQLWQGELLEVRGERLGYLQVWDPRRERGGYVRASQLRPLPGTAADATELLAVLRFVREAPGREALGIGLAGAWLRAAPAEAVGGESGVEVLDALGTLADRLAVRASTGAALSRPLQAATAAHLEVAAQYGVRFASYEQDGRMQVCYDGDAFRRVLAVAAQPQQQARAALGLTRADCVDPALPPSQRHAVNQWRAEVLDRVAIGALGGPLRQRVLLRQAAVWSALAWEQARLGQPPAAAAERALAALAAVRRSELPEEDGAAYNDAVMRVNASRWAAVPAPAQDPGIGPTVVTEAGRPGETCVLLVDAKHGVQRPLARRCTFSVVWPQSAALNREGNALVLAVQPLEAWRELWLFRRQGASWNIDVLPPAGVAPGIGYAEFAGWVPGGRHLLAAREARGEGRYRRSYEVVAMDSLAVLQQAGDAAALRAFQRWSDPAWKRMTTGLR